MFSSVSRGAVVVEGGRRGLVECTQHWELLLPLGHKITGGR